MKQFYEFLQLIGDVMPDWVSLILCPALLLCVGFLFAVLHKKKAYLPAAVGLGAAGFFLVLCESVTVSVGYALAYLALFAVFSVFVRLLFFIPFPAGKKDSDELYKKFAVPLDAGAESVGSAEPETEVAEEESGLRLDHAASLMERLEKCELSASDRLEVDSLSHTLESFRGRALTSQEIRAVNDCLSTILKLTAKYKL